MRKTEMQARLEHAEAKVAEVEERYRAVVELANVGVWITDDEGNTTFTDPRLCRALGYRAGELRGHSLDEFVVKRKRRVNGSTKSNRFAGKRAAKAVDEGELRRRNGETISVMLADRPLRNGNGDGSAALTLITESGDQKQAEEETALLKNRFFELISHELRTPLTAMIGFLELIDATQRDNLDEEGREYFEMIRRDADRLSRVLGDLYMLSRVEGGEFAVECDQANLAQLAKTAVERARPAAEEAGVKLTFSNGQKLGCWGDDDRLGQVLDNLIMNAIKFTPSGGRVEVGIWSARDSAVIEVSDDGPGIPPEEAKSVFGRFYRASEARAKQVQGLGLGLAIVKAIVDAHGGEIDLASEPGSGSTFTVRLPRKRPAPGSRRWSKTSAVRLRSGSPSRA